MENLGSVLIVDDLPANVRLLSGILKVAGYNVSTASNGAQALEQIAAAMPDLVLLDIMMPEMDGLEICRRIKYAPVTSWLPVVMVTALQDSADRVAAFEAGADDFLTKPVDEVEVVARVQSLVRLKRQREELENAYKELRRAESMREGLSAMLVHDLRTPLTAILGSIETLQTTTLDTIQTDLLDICSRSSTRLLRLVNDLLDVSKMESGEMKLARDTFRLEDLLRESLDAAIPKGGQLGLMPLQGESVATVNIAPEAAQIRGDADLLGRVLVNLIGNASKYALKPGGIAITVTCPAGEGVQFSIRDNGPGISPEDHARIFEKFGQVGNQHASRKLSTGLGLTFCKLAVEAHGGRIWVESAPGAGSDFRFTIPQSATVSSL